MIVIPTYNERENIATLVKHIRQSLGGVPIFFIDDSSPDGTAAEITRLMQSDRNILLKVRPKKMGLGSAYRDAFKKILRDNSAAFVVTMDADLSHPAETLPELVRALEQSDVAIGSRYVVGGNIANWKRLRKLLSRFSNLYARILTDMQTRDLTAGFVAYKTEALKKLNLDHIQSDGYAFQIEMKYRLAKQGASFHELPITFKERANGKSKLNKRVILEAALLPFQFLFKDHQFLSLLFVFLASLTVYTLTIPRTIFLNDNAEFVTAAATLGIPHPSGYPLYVLLSSIFAHIPFGDLVFKVNLFSSICASCSLVVLAVIIRKMIDAKSNTTLWYAAAASLILGFTSMFWFQAIVAKVYTLNLLLILLLLYIAIDYLAAKKATHIFWFALLSGLALSNHLMSVLIIPFLALAFLNKDIIKPKILGKALLLFLLGLSIYIYLPLRAQFNPPLNWGHVERGVSFVIHHITRAQYGDFGTGGLFEDKVRFIGSFFLSATREFSILLIAAVLALFIVALTERKQFFLILSVIFGNSILIILLRSAPYSQLAAEYFYTYYLPAYAGITILIAVGLWYLGLMLNKKQTTALVLAALCAGWFLWRSFPERDFSSFTFIEKYTAEALRSLPHNAVLVFGTENAAEDTALFALMYQQYVHGLRPDVQIVAYVDVFPQKNDREVDLAYQEQNPKIRHGMLIAYAESEYPSRPIFSTFIFNDSGTNCVCRSNGYFFQVSGAPYQTSAEPVKPSDGDMRILESDYFGKQILANYHYQTAAFWLDRESKNSGPHLLSAIANDQDVLGWQIQEYFRFRDSKKQLTESLRQ